MPTAATATGASSSPAARPIFARALLAAAALPLIAAAPIDRFEVAAAPQTHASAADAAAPQPMARLRIKGTDLNVRIALGFDKALLLNMAGATRARLKAFPLIGKQTFKSNLMPGGSALIRGNLYDIGIAGLPETNVPTIWFDKELADDSDGVISLLAVPAEHVVVTQPNAPKGGLVYGIGRKGKGDAAMVTLIGAEKVHVILDVRSPETLFNGRAAQLMERAGLFRRTGKVGLWRPFPGTALPFERVVPTPGAAVLGLPLITPAARVTEARAKELDTRAKAGTSSAEQDDDAITVTAQRKKQQPPWILIGRDVLDYCSRIELDRPGVRWALTCNFTRG